MNKKEVINTILDLFEENLVVGPPSDETARKILLKILDKEDK